MVYKKPHKNAEAIKAWTDRVKIQYRPRGGGGDRYDCSTSTPSQAYDYEYRVKPEPQPDIEREFLLIFDSIAGPIAACGLANTAAGFDAETGKPKSISKV